MSDVDHYITDEVMRCALLPKSERGVDAEDNLRRALRAALPGILARHRADVLREAAERLGAHVPPGGILPGAVLDLRAWADEAVTE